MPENPKFRHHRINIYTTPEDKQLIADLATTLHKQGVPGMLNAKGQPINAAVVKYALRRLTDNKTTT